MDEDNVDTREDTEGEIATMAVIALPVAAYAGFGLHWWPIAGMFFLLSIALGLRIMERRQGRQV